MPYIYMHAVSLSSHCGRYDKVKKPKWTPPKWMFPVVWPILYASQVQWGPCMSLSWARYRLGICCPCVLVATLLCRMATQPQDDRPTPPHPFALCAPPTHPAPLPCPAPPAPLPCPAPPAPLPCPTCPAPLPCPACPVGLVPYALLAPHAVLALHAYPVSQGVASWLVWRIKKTENRKLPLILYGVQLVLNLAWQPLFFKVTKGHLCYSCFAPKLGDCFLGGDNQICYSHYAALRLALLKLQRTFPEVQQALEKCRRLAISLVSHAVARLFYEQDCSAEYYSNFLLTFPLLPPMAAPTFIPSSHSVRLSCSKHWCNIIFSPLFPPSFPQHFPVLSPCLQHCRMAFFL